MQNKGVHIIKHYPQRDPDRRGPLTKDHSLIKDFNRPCPLCGFPFSEGDYITLIPLDIQHKTKRRGFHQAIAVPAHWACYENEIE